MQSRNTVLTLIVSSLLGSVAFRDLRLWLCGSLEAAGAETLSGGILNEPGWMIYHRPGAAGRHTCVRDEKAY